MIIKNKSLFLKNKKGDASSIIISLIIIIFFIGIFSIVFSKIFIDVLQNLQTQSDFPQNSLDVMNKVENSTIPFLDYFAFFSFISIFLGIIISSIFIDTHPVFLILFIVLIIIAIVLAGIFANVYTEIGETSELSSTYLQFKYTNLIMEHYPLWIFVCGIIVAIILYNKSGNISGGEL